LSRIPRKTGSAVEHKATIHLDFDDSLADRRCVKGQEGPQKSRIYGMMAIFSAQGKVGAPVAQIADEALSTVLYADQ
jgi:hypothetical protein